MVFTDQEFKRWMFIPMQTASTHGKHRNDVDQPWRVNNAGFAKFAVTGLLHAAPAFEPVTLIASTNRYFLQSRQALQLAPQSMRLHGCRCL